MLYGCLIADPVLYRGRQMEIKNCEKKSVLTKTIISRLSWMWHVVCMFVTLKCVKHKTTIMNIFRKDMNVHVRVHMAFLQLKKHANNIK